MNAKYPCDQDSFLLIMLFIFFGALYVFGGSVREQDADSWAANFG
jgi:hypothetical protein